MGRFLLEASPLYKCPWNEDELLAWFLWIHGLPDIENEFPWPSWATFVILLVYEKILNFYPHLEAKDFWIFVSSNPPPICRLNEERTRFGLLSWGFPIQLFVPPSEVGEFLDCSGLPTAAWGETLKSWPNLWAVFWVSLPKRRRKIQRS